jgi:two-component system chemotaxis response regulator CheV
VDTILRLDWSQMRVPPAMLLADMGGLVTAVTELPDGRLVMMMDVEKILSETTNYDDELIVTAISSRSKILNVTVFFADDSAVARKQIQRTGGYGGEVRGSDQWPSKPGELEKMAAYAQASGQKWRPDQSGADRYRNAGDGWLYLTKKIKSDPRFVNVPVIMHSSLSGMSNQQLGKSVGVDEYVPKFEPQRCRRR